MIKHFISSVCFIFCFCSFIQASEIVDSLIVQVELAKGDSEKVFFMNEISWNSLQNDLELAEKYNKQALTICKSNNFQKQKAEVLGVTSAIYKRKGDYPNAIKTQLELLKILEEIKHDHSIAMALSNIGIFYTRLSEFEKAQDYYEQAESIFIKTSDTAGLAQVYSQMGNNLLGKGNPELALGYLTQAMDLIRILDDDQQLAIGMLNLANVHAELNNNEMVLESFTEASEIFQKIGDRIGYAITLANIGEHQFKQKKYKEGIALIKSAIEIAEELQYADLVLHCHELLYTNYKLTNDYKNALAQFEIASAIKDSTFNESKSQQIAEMETKYQTEQKEQKIALLDEQNKVQQLELDQKNRLLFGMGGGALGVLIIIVLMVMNQRNKAGKKEAEFAKKQAELKQQALRAQMNPHFLFNSLNSIQRIYVEGNMMLANDYMADFSALLRSILNNSDKEQISLKEDLEMLELYLTMEKVRTDGQLNYKIHIDPNVDQRNTKVPPMIIQPFVENAIWHGILPNKKPGNISIQLRPIDESLIECIVQDDGVGVETSRKNKKEGHISKGMALTKERLGSKGSFTEEELPEGGTKITINIPVV